MKRWNPSRVAHSLHARMAVLLGVSVLAAGIGFEVLLVTLVHRSLEQELVTRSHAMVNLAAGQAYTTLAVSDTLELGDQLSHLAMESDVVGIAAYRADGRLLVARVSDEKRWEAAGARLDARGRDARGLRRVRASGPPLLDLAMPVIRRVPVGGGPVDEAAEVFGLAPVRSAASRTEPGIGWIRLVVSGERVERAVGVAGRLGLIVLLITLAIAVLSLSALVRMVVRPLRDAGALAHEIAEGHLERRLPVRGEDELAALAQAMNTMAVALVDARQLGHDEAEALRNATSAMQAIARGAHAVRDVRGVFALVAEQARLVTRCEGVALAVPSGPLHDLALSEFDPPAPWGEVRAGTPMTRGLLNQWIAPGQAATRLALEPPRDALTRKLWLDGYRSAAFVPLLTRGATPAMLLLVARDANAFPESETLVVAALASHLTSALESAQLQERLERAIGELQRTRDSLVRSETLRLAGEMATGVAHEFNNVLGAILGRAQLLRRSAEADRLPPDELDAGLRLIERAAGDGAETVSRLRQFGRSSESSESAAVDLGEIAHDALEFTRPRWSNAAQAAGRTLHVSLDAEEGCWVSGRAHELREVFTNLILNAVDALPRGGNVDVRVHRDGPRVVAEVKDDGVGMEEGVREHLFEPFFTTKGAAGAGLGLSVVYGIVQRHGGSIRVFSRVGVGSRFEVVLPLGEARAPAAVVANRPAVEVRRLRVMVVDDEPAVRDLLRDMVAALGHDVEAYESGVEAFKHYRPGSIDLLLTDLGMPGVSGWKLSSNIRAVDPDVTIVYVTGWGEDMNLDDVREAGADLVIAKPFTLEDVVGATQMAAERARGDRAA